MSVQPHSSLAGPREHGPDERVPVPDEPADGISPPLRLPLGELAEGLKGDLALEQPCAGCAGLAFVPVVAGRLCANCAGRGSELDGDDWLPCPVCEGTGWTPVEVMEQCDDCDGTGLELTVAGGRLLQRAGPQLRGFLNRWQAGRKRA